MNNKSNEEKDKDWKYIKDNWHVLTYWDRLHLVLLARWCLIRRRLRDIPLRWIRYQFRKSQEQGVVKREIESTDKGIDKLVSGLSEEEVKIVEE